MWSAIVLTGLGMLCWRGLQGELIAAGRSPRRVRFELELIYRGLVLVLVPVTLLAEWSALGSVGRTGAGSALLLLVASFYAYEIRTLWPTLLPHVRFHHVAHVIVPPLFVAQGYYLGAPAVLMLVLATYILSPLSFLASGRTRRRQLRRWDYRLRCLSLIPDLVMLAVLLSQAGPMWSAGALRYLTSVATVLLLLGIHSSYLYIQAVETLGRRRLAAS